MSKEKQFEHTIAAISTPPGRGGIGIIRLSGGKSLEIARKITGKKKFEHRKMVFSRFYNPVSKELIDEGYTVFFKKPHSYTGEDVVEFHAHGSPFVLNELLSAVLHSGAHPARPGEFTQRAFLNDKLDLTMAEGVIDLINAETRSQHRAALRQLQGEIGEKFRKLKEDLVYLISRIELNLDFSDQDIPVFSSEFIAEEGKKLLDKIEKLLKSYDAGSVIKNGLKVVITGKPNTGKSSLFNFLVRKNRAIVSDVPGTTRDYLEETIEIKGQKVILIDTAGIRKNGEKIETFGIERAKSLIEEGDIVLFLTDGSKKIDEDDLEIFKIVKDKNYIPIINKIDIEEKQNGICEEIGNCLRVSVKHEIGLDELVKQLEKKMYQKGVVSTNELIITNRRHFLNLQKCKEGVISAIKDLESGIPPDVAVINLYDSLEALDEILGKKEGIILDTIFKNFCIGK